MKKQDLAKLLEGNSYPGRGILLGKSPDGQHAVLAYFIMGRSENSRNRVFVADGNGLRTQAFDPAKLTDPSLVIYRPVRVFGDTTIVTNGDQTDTIYDFFQQGESFADALRSRTFEPDPPHYTPRISGMAVCAQGTLSYALSILKSADGNPEGVQRYLYEYTNPSAGTGHLLHTYREDANPIPSFEGEPRPVETDDDIDRFTATLWESLNADNKVSLFVRYIRLSDGVSETRIQNKNHRSFTVY